MLSSLEVPEDENSKQTLADVRPPYFLRMSLPITTALLILFISLLWTSTLDVFYFQ